MEIIIEELDISNKNELIISAYVNDCETVSTMHMHTAGFHAILDGSRLYVAIYPYIGALKFFFNDPQNYVYLIDENMVIPKQLAGSVASNRKKKAPKELCCTDIDGIFLPLPIHNKELYYDEKRYKENYRSKREYIMIDIANLSLDWLSCYINSFISDLIAQTSIQ